MTTIGDQIKALRKRAGISREDLADAVGVHVNTLYSWENDITFPSLPNLVTMAGVLGVTTDRIIYGESPQEPAGEPESAGQ